tara:strand:- start:192 stop:422 length:231 start_codon:yes stop_codon:yes gene_type:complete
MELTKIQYEAIKKCSEEGPEITGPGQGTTYLASQMLAKMFLEKQKKKEQENKPKIKKGFRGYKDPDKKNNQRGISP